MAERLRVIFGGSSWILRFPTVNNSDYWILGFIHDDGVVLALVPSRFREFRWERDGNRLTLLVLKLIVACCRGISSPLVDWRLAY
jgi:hypothetical protein